MSEAAPAEPGSVHLGIGMASTASVAEVYRLVAEVLVEAEMSGEPGASGRMVAVGTIDRLAADPRLAGLGVPVTGWSPAVLASTVGTSPGGSARVAAVAGTPSVAEAAALRSAGDGARLLVPRRASAHVTAAVAVAGGGERVGP